MEQVLPRRKNYLLNKVWKAIGRSLNNAFASFKLSKQYEANRTIARQLQACEFPNEDYYHILARLNKSAFERYKGELK